jgi:hypothetical protein
LLLTTRLGSPLIQGIQDHPHTVLVSGSNEIMLLLASVNKVLLVTHTHTHKNLTAVCFYVLYLLAHGQVL